MLTHDVDNSPSNFQQTGMSLRSPSQAISRTAGQVAIQNCSICLIEDQIELVLHLKLDTLLTAFVCGRLGFNTAKLDKLIVHSA